MGMRSPSLSVRPTRGEMFSRQRADLSKENGLITRYLNPAPPHSRSPHATTHAIAPAGQAAGA